MESLVLVLLFAVAAPALIKANCRDSYANRRHMDHVLYMGITSGDVNGDRQLSRTEIRSEFCGGSNWPNCNRRQQMAVQNIINNADKNPFDARISQRELQTYLSKLQGSTREDYLSMIYNYLDQSGDRNLKRSDFMFLAKKFCNNMGLGLIQCAMQNGREAIDTFNHFDCDSNNQISSNEMRRVAISAFSQYN